MAQVKCSAKALLPLLLLLLLRAAAAVDPFEHYGAHRDTARAACDAVDWWKRTTYYQIFVRSFQDSDGDGNGDLRGVTQRLDYLQRIGAETLLLSAFYQSPRRDANYDVSDHFAFDPLYGGRFDFEKLVAGAHERGMRVVVDLVANHMSRASYAFRCSERAYEDARCARYKDYFVWAKPKLTAVGEPDLSRPPNNWLSVFGNRSAWTWSGRRREWYYHQYLADQPDLNLRTADVRTMLRQVARHWLNLGADGLRAVSVGSLFERDHLADEPANPAYDPLVDSPYERLEHAHTRALDESFAVIADWRQVVDEPPYLDPRTGKSTKVLLVETSPYESAERALAALAPNGSRADLVYNYELLNELGAASWSPGGAERAALRCLRPAKQLQWPMGADGTRAPWPTWVTGTHDVPRLVQRLGGAPQALAYQWLAFMLPGAPVVYYGDELPLANANFGHILDATRSEGESSRLGCRAPMAWSARETSGDFTTNATYTWMPVNSDYRQTNVATLLHAAAADGTMGRNRTRPNVLRAFARMAEIRRAYLPTFLFGDLVLFETGAASPVLAVARKTRLDWSNGHDLLLLANTDAERPAPVQLRETKSLYEETLTAPPVMGQVLALSGPGAGELRDGSPVRVGELVSFDRLRLRPAQAIVFKF